MLLLRFWSLINTLKLKKRLKWSEATWTKDKQRTMRPRRVSVLWVGAAWCSCLGLSLNLLLKAVPTWGLSTMKANRCRCVPSTLQQPLSSRAQLRYRACILCLVMRPRRGRWLNCGRRLRCSAAQFFLRQTDCATSSRSVLPLPLCVRHFEARHVSCICPFVRTFFTCSPGGNLQKNGNMFCMSASVLDYFRSVCTRRRWLLSCLLTLSLGFLHCSHVLSCARGKSCDSRFSMVTHEIHCHWLHMHFLTANWERLHAALHKEGGGGLVKAYCTSIV